MKIPMVFLLVLAVPSTAGAITADEVIQKMDDQMTFSSRVGKASMWVYKNGTVTDRKSMQMWARGADETYIEFLAPARDKGIKYLKMTKNLYMCMPQTSRVMKISGHMLRQSLMGSDFSYEDMLESKGLLSDYNATLKGEETKGGEPCYVVELKAKRPDVSYYRRKIWVSKKTFIARRAERFARSGTLMKVYTASGVKAHGSRYYPAVMTMRDKLKKGTKTQLRMPNLKFNVPVPRRLFNRRALMRGC